MTKRCYHIEPQRLVPGEGYKPCEPHRACRVLVIETTAVPRSRNRRAYQVKKTVANFGGSAMMLRAKQECDWLTARTAKKPERPGAIWGRSCTINEYNQIMRSRS